MKATVIPATGPLSVKCPLCGAEPGTGCKSKDIHVIHTTGQSHLVRIRLSKGMKRSSS